MENKIDPIKIERYAETLAGKLCNQHFVDHDFIDGKRITEFTPIKQINYFILENIFGNWIEETSKLESPYFDYDSENVQSAIRVFMNKLSHHIKVNRDNFEPLLIAATRDTINLVLSPYTFFKQEYFTDERGKISMEELKELAKYIKLNDILITELIAEVSKFNLDEILIEELLSKFGDIYNQHSDKLTDVNTFINEISAIHPVTANDFLKKDAQIESQSTIQSGENLNSSLASDQTTLNDSFKVGQTTTLADAHGKGKIESIKSSIAINQKYVFVSELFAGSDSQFNTAIDEMDSCDSLNSANVLLDDYAQKFKWDMDSEAAKNLIDIVSRKF